MRIAPEANPGLANIDWDDLDTWRYRDEAEAVAELLATPPLEPPDREIVRATAAKIVTTIRATGQESLLEEFLRRFPLSTREGIALMSLAEALLRTPDAATQDELVGEKISAAVWTPRQNGEESWLVEVARRGLALAARLDATASPTGRRVTSKVLRPAIRRAALATVKRMGHHFVFGTTIESALARAAAENLLCSFDMLGEGARTDADAERYAQIYAHAIEQIGARAGQAGPALSQGISIKLSALCPRFEATQERYVWDFLLPRLHSLAALAAHHDLNLCIDAEESHRLIPSLQLLDSLARDRNLRDWSGLGIAVQAYQKRAPQVIAMLESLACDTKRPLMVRLVKGAYWDSEIKQAQVAGRPDYPVFTTKAATDLCYLERARSLLRAAPMLYPQFATHNAHTLVAVQHMASAAGVAFECQRLHGMGVALYDAVSHDSAPPVRVYAPVGGHAELLPYLVRRLLENGANSSFVNALFDPDVSATTLAADPLDIVTAHPGRHPAISLPTAILQPARMTAAGRDYSMRSDRERTAAAFKVIDQTRLVAAPIIGGQMRVGMTDRPVHSPADHAHIVGMTGHATPSDLDAACAVARSAQPAWNAIGGEARAKVLRAMADALEERMDELIALLAREGGKTLDDGVAEVREAIDFCRYYAVLAVKQFARPETLRGPAGESNQLALSGRGVFACISPWNFPLAIFTGQIAAALAAGNAVIAKPAEQTPLIAAQAVRLFVAAGLNGDLLSLLPGTGEDIGAALVSHPGIDGIAFTGGTDTAQAIQRALAARPGRIIPFIAETGGLNGMFVDTTALREQVVDDVLVSAMRSAGQRCSALRVLFLPELCADEFLQAIGGALATLRIGDPADPETDIGPVIDDTARATLERHVRKLETQATIIARLHPPSTASGSFFGPVIVEISTPDFLDREVFGPILHVYRYREEEFEEIAARFAAPGYGLTLGIHSRRRAFVDRVRAIVPAGNCYVNRSMIGAVVGVQPFGGDGLSGTGPKAGSPYSLLRYATERTLSINLAAQGGDPGLLGL